MKTKSYSGRVSGENLREVEAFAEAHGVPFSSAVSSLLAEGRAAREGKPICRWAVIDPESVAHYGVALEALHAVADALRRSRAALARPRPANAEDVVEWEQMRIAAREAFRGVTQNIEAVRNAGRLALTNWDRLRMEAAYETARRGSFIREFFGVLLGKAELEKSAELAADSLPKSGGGL